MRHSSAVQTPAEKGMLRRLRDVLLRVTASREELREETSSPSEDFATVIKRLSQEIDETVLPRKLALFSDAGIEATFIVSNRRLVEMEIGERKVDFQLETDASADSVSRLCAKAIKGLSFTSGPLSLRPIGRVPKVTTSGGTCAASHLAEYSDSAKLENRLKAFLKVSHSQSLGWVYRSGDAPDVTHSVDQEIMEKLRRVQDILASQYEDGASFRRLEKSGPTCSAFAITADIQVLIAGDGNDHLVAAFPVSELRTTLAKWHQIYKRPER